DAETGLVRDNSAEDTRATIAGSGFALCNYVIAAERSYLAREDAAERARRALRFLWNAPQGDSRDATGTHGFFYHFLDMRSGRRMWRCEVSTIDSTILFAGALVAAAYFDRATATEYEIRWTADALYRRADWTWSLDGGKLVSLGWRPERGFLPYHWAGYTEALLLYVLALGSPTHPIPSECYAEWCKGYRWRSLYGYELLYAGPLFIHQLSHAWIDFRGIRDAYMEARGSDYFENSRRATYVQRAYATRNPRRFVGYDAECWGLTACDGPGPAVRSINGGARRSWHYRARGVPFGPDDGTVSPSAIVASLPFAPEIVVPTIEAMRARHPSIDRAYGLACGFNPSVRVEGNGDTRGWVSPVHYAIDQGLMVMMLENARSELIWRLMRTCPYVVDGLRRAGFTGGWLSSRHGMHPERSGNR
ncbi:MAG TPA: glucoamylase family protein, partial [Gemmatimonadaceae bacterium]|nr:glucoamylase family protein [Gemmatimonadaceae bacterium]